jgi:hypothetical protein
MLNVLVFPCGSEVALELHRSLRYSSHVNLIGASSVRDHGAFRYEDYVEGLPYVDAPGFIAALAALVRERRIDAVFPAMDSVMSVLKAHEAELGCRVIASPDETIRICSSKTATYDRLRGTVRVPALYPSPHAVDNYPVFLKPDVGYGSRGTLRADTAEAAAAHLRSRPDCIVLEYLPGPEYTVDCFTDRLGVLRFVGPRSRRRVLNGISVNTIAVEDTHGDFRDMAERINDVLRFRGAWFFQVKEASDGQLALLEVASRPGGSSALFRNRGVNFALLSIFDAFDLDVEIAPNCYGIELDRALSNVYRIDCAFDTVYVDFDDCLVIRGKVNTALVAFLYQALNGGARVHLLTRHQYDIHESLAALRLSGIFDSVIHLRNGEPKADHITAGRAIFIDDSFRERRLVREKLGIPVFAPDMVESLLTP